MSNHDMKTVFTVVEAIAYALEAKQKLSEVTKELNDTRLKLDEARGRATSQDSIRDAQLVGSVKSWLRKYPHLFISGEGSSYLAGLCVLMKEYDSYRKKEFGNPDKESTPPNAPTFKTVFEYKNSKEAELTRVEILQKTFSKIKQELARPDFSPERMEALVRTFNSFNL